MARQIEFVEAKRDNLKARIAISAPSGAGKTTQSLWLAEALIPEGGKIAVIDTERGSAKLYAYDHKTGEGHVFDHYDWQPPYAPLELADAIDTHGGAFDVIIIDSLSHFWNGQGGILQTVDKAKDKITGWRMATPMQDRMISSILNAPCHVICNTRAKTDTTLEKGQNGKMQVRSFGMKAIQRDDVIYEFTIVLEIDKDTHETSVSKTRMPSIAGHTFQTPGDITRLGKTIKEWLNIDNEEAIAANKAMVDAVNQGTQAAADASENITEEDVSTSVISDEQVEQISAIFNALPEGAERNAAKTHFQEVYANPRTISVDGFDSAYEEAKEIAQKARAAA